MTDVFEKVAAHTKPKCATCRAPHACCSAEYCHMALRRAKDAGEPLIPTGHPRLPLMGPDGCTAPARHRPICAVHVCEQHLMEDNEWTRTYWKFREEMDQALFEEIMTEREEGT